MHFSGFIANFATKTTTMSTTNGDINMKVIEFITNGVNVFRDASRGQYVDSSEVVAQFRREILDHQYSPADDRRNLLRDRRNVAADLRCFIKK